MESINAESDDVTAPVDARHTLAEGVKPVGIQGTRVVLWVASGAPFDVTTLASRLSGANHGSATVTLVSVEEVSANGAIHAMPIDDPSACALICGHAAQCDSASGACMAGKACGTGTAQAAAAARRHHGLRRAERFARGVAAHRRATAAARPQVAHSVASVDAVIRTAAAAEGAPITVMVASDRQGLLAALLPHLEAERDIHVLGDPVAEPAQLVACLEQRQPRLLLLDKHLFDRLGASSVSLIHARAPGTRVLLLCDEACAGLAEEVLRNRFHGFLLASCRPEASVKALRAVSRGELWLPRTLLANAIAAPVPASERGEVAVHIDPSLVEAMKKLTPREAQVVGYLRQGLTNKEIARSLGVMEDTVKKHLQSVFAKLGVHRRALVVLCPAAGASGRA